MGFDFKAMHPVLERITQRRLCRHHGPAEHIWLDAALIMLRRRREVDGQPPSGLTYEACVAAYKTGGWSAFVALEPVQLAMAMMLMEHPGWHCKSCGRDRYGASLAIARIKKRKMPRRK